MDKQSVRDALDGALTFASGLTPGAIGAALSVAYEHGLTWMQRFVAFATGIVVSYFAGQAFVSVFNPNPFMAQGFAFTVGLVAYKSVPGFIKSASETIASIPAAIRDKLGLKPKA
jgi:hypothetical protein